MMIQPLPNGNEETGDISLKVVRKNDDNKISEKAEENDYDSSEVSFDPNDIKFIATPLKKSRSTLKRAATRNNLNIEISPVYKACQAGDLRNLKTFVRQADIKSKELSADLVNVVDESLFTPLHYAAIHNHADILAFLLSKGADIDAVGGCLSRTPLHMAVENNSLKSIRELISRDADMFITDEHNQHVVHIAAKQGNSETTKLILENLQQYSLTLINDVDDENMTALHHAADRCHYGVCQLLIEHGAKLAVVANEGSTCLHLAAYRLDLGIMELLLRTAENQGIKQFINMGDSDGKTVLEIAVELNHFEMTQLCLTYGADPAGDPIKSGDGPHQSRSKSLLHIVAINGHIEIAKLLVQYGVCLESADDKGRTAMHFAALGNHPHVIRYLHKQGLHIDIMDKNKVTPFLTALQRGYINMIRTLLNLGANIMHVDINNRNCLHYAVNHQDISLLQLLFDRGAVSAINDKDRNGDTPLLVCIPNRNEQAINMLINYGADATLTNKAGDTYLHIAAAHNGFSSIRTIYSKHSLNTNTNNYKGITALHIAAHRGYHETVQTLLDIGADVDNNDIFGNTPLHGAAEENKVAVIKLLVKQSADINAVNRKKNTPLHRACQKNSLDAAKWLLNHNADISRRNIKGQTCLDVAIENDRVDIGLAIISDDRWQAVMDCRGPDGYTPMKRLVEKMPKVAEAVMDRCVVHSTHPSNHPDAFITFNFKYIESSPEHVHLQENKDKYLTISSMVASNRSELLSHPLTMAYRMQKWNGGIGLAYYLKLIFYIIIVSIFVLAMGLDIICHPSAKKRINNTIIDCSFFSRTFINNSSIVVMILGFMVLFAHFIYIWRWPFEYLKKLSINGIEVIIAFLAIIVSIISLTRRHNTVNEQAGAVLIFLTQLVLIVNLQRAHFFGKYVVMFISVLKTVIKVMFLVALFLFIFMISFVMAFNINDTAPFATIFNSVLSTVVMFSGEINFNSNFQSPSHNLPPGQLVSLGLLLIAFIIIMNITLSNLLIGLAVGDIQELQQQAELTSIVHDLVLIYEYNNQYPLFIRKWLYRPTSIIKASGPEGKFKRYVWESVSERAKLLSILRQKCIHICSNEVKSVAEENNRSLLDEITALKASVKALTEQNEITQNNNDYLTKIIQAIAIKVDASIADLK